MKLKLWPRRKTRERGEAWQARLYLRLIVLLLAVAYAIAFVLAHGVTGNAYNVCGAQETTNREVVTALLAYLGKPWSLVRSVADRPGHDRRYSMSGERLNVLGFRHRVPFVDGLAATVRWYVDNEDWWRRVRSGDWNDYYARQYADRLATSTAAD